MRLPQAFEKYDDNQQMRRKSLPTAAFETIRRLKDLYYWVEQGMTPISKRLPKHMVDDAKADDWIAVDEK